MVLCWSTIHFLKGLVYVLFVFLLNRVLIRVNASFDYHCYWWRNYWYGKIDFQYFNNNEYSVLAIFSIWNELQTVLVQKESRKTSKLWHFLMYQISALCYCICWLCYCYWLLLLLEAVFLLHKIAGYGPSLSLVFF